MEDDLEALKASWIEEQDKLKARLVVNDIEEWQSKR